MYYNALTVGNHSVDRINALRSGFYIAYFHSADAVSRIVGGRLLSCTHAFYARHDVADADAVGPNAHLLCIAALRTASTQAIKMLRIGSGVGDVVERGERVLQCRTSILFFFFIRDLVSQLLIIIRVGDKRLNTIDICIGLPLNFLIEIFRTAAP